MDGEKEREFSHCLMTASQNIVQENARKTRLLLRTRKFQIGKMMDICWSSFHHKGKLSMFLETVQ
jgi:hypothetical protein